VSEGTGRVGPTMGYLLWRVTLKWVAAVDRALVPFGLTHAQYSLLASLYGLARAGRRPSQRELADVTGLEPMFVSKLARVLERDGLIEREPNPADPRAVQLRVTARGLEVVEAAIRVVRDLQEERLAPLGGSASPRSAALRRALLALLNEKETDDA
jgi:MarR family transcriptional regulator, organic hydroperoxide resistance regulator